MQCFASISSIMMIMVDHFHIPFHIISLSNNGLMRTGECINLQNPFFLTFLSNFPAFATKSLIKVQVHPSMGGWAHKFVVLCFLYNTQKASCLLVIQDFYHCFSDSHEIKHVPVTCLMPPTFMTIFWELLFNYYVDNVKIGFQYTPINSNDIDPDNDITYIFFLW